MKRYIMLLAIVSGLVSCVAINSSYIGKSYPVTSKPEVYFSWNDVTRPYETMGHIEATPYYQKTFEDAQRLIEQRAYEKGADAVVFTGIKRDGDNPSIETTEQITPNTAGGQTHTVISSGNSSGTRRLTAVFIKYKK